MVAITPGSLKLALDNGLKEAACQWAQITEPAVNPLINLLRVAAYAKGPLTGLAAEAAAPVLRRAQDYYVQWVCGGDPETTPQWDFSPGFSGGQCPVNYVVVATTSGQTKTGGGFTTPPASRTMVGPIREFGVRSAPFPPTGTSWTSFGIDGNGNEVVFASTTFPSDPENRYDSINIQSITRSDSQPDNCGDPDPIIPDGSDEEGGTLDIIGEDENGDPVNIPDVPFVLFQPTLNLNGDLVVNVNLPTLDICGLFNFGPDGGFVPQSCGPTNSPPPTPDDEPKGDGDTEPDPELDDEDPEDEVEEGETIQATVIKSQRLIDNISQTQIPGGEGPTILFPRIATISWKVERQLESETIDGWTRPIDIQSVNAWYEAPKDGRVVATSVVWQPNWEGTYQNVKAPYPEPCCGEQPTAPQLPSA